MDCASKKDDESHVLYFYDDKAGLITDIGRGSCIALNQGHGVVCIASDSHRRLLERYLLDRGIDVRAARARGQLVCLNAVKTLGKISRDDSIDATRFAEVVGMVVDVVSARYPRVWIFGELVALMCVNGHHDGAVKLERLWNSFTASRPSVFLRCAYPAHAFAMSEERVAFLQICDEHCRVLHGESSLIGKAGG